MTPDELLSLLVGFGFAEPSENPVVEPLAGGVSSGIYRVAVASGTYCVKQALPRLKVVKEWRVPTDRVHAEVAWLAAAADIVPGHAPRVLGVDDATDAFVMEYLEPARFRNWKASLMAGAVDARAGRQVASVLGRVHAATARSQAREKIFSCHDNFALLRLEPYFLETAEHHPDLADRLTGMVRDLQSNRKAVVHGDVSPKNILIGEDGPVVLDAECACYGDPAFDLAFLLKHLLLKAVLRPDRHAEIRDLIEVVRSEYFAHVSWEPVDALERRVARLIPGLLLARVDGKSPVEYLSDAQREEVRTAARDLIKEPLEDVTEVVAGWLVKGWS